MPAPPRSLKAVLVPADEPDVGFDGEGPAFDSSRTLTTTAWRPGRMRVCWIVAEENEDHSRGGGMVADAAPEQFVQVYESSAEQVFDVTIASEELARILAAYQ